MSCNHPVVCCADCGTATWPNAESFSIQGVYLCAQCEAKRYGWQWKRCRLCGHIHPANGETDICCACGYDAIEHGQWKDCPHCGKRFFSDEAHPYLCNDCECPAEPPAR